MQLIQKKLRREILQSKLFNDAFMTLLPPSNIRRAQSAVFREQESFGARKREICLGKNDWEMTLYSSHKTRCKN